MIHGGEADNVIPDEVVLRGTARYFDPALAAFISNRMQQTVESICAAAGAKGETEYRRFYIPTINNTDMVDFAKDTVQAYLGKDYWHESAPPSMGGEDFSYYLEKVPGAMLRIGMGKTSSELHNPMFDFNDEALRAGIMTFCGLVLEFNT
jgi:metal-dependent amidase/aminoacylase/carboxypeptidase family protein